MYNKMFYEVFVVVLVLLLTTTGGIEEGARVKRPRAESSAVGREPAQALDAPEQDPPTAPPNFLSPSVKEYLELGMAIPGKPGTDYPVLGAVPYTNFYCDEQPYPGFFADMETRCQAWHYCDIDGRQASFLCPNGTVFSQAVASCDWWFNVHCSLSPSLYPLNARLYRRRRKSKKSLKPKPHRVINQQMLDEIFLEYNPMEEEVVTFGLPAGRDISIRPLPSITTPVNWDLTKFKKHLEDYEHEFLDL